MLFDTTQKIDRDDSLPRHTQVKQILRDMVTSGRLKPGDKIPAELQIAESLGVSKMTANKALLSLVADGFLVREVGRGTFVAPAGGSEPVVAPAPRVTLSFVEGARNVLDSDYYGTLYRGIVDGLQGVGGRVDISLSPVATGDYQAEDAAAPADGRLIIAPRAESVDSIEALWADGKSLVVVGASWPTMGIPSVDSDNIGGAVEAVRHLISLGHERIGLVYAEPETANTQDRVAGYRRALEAAGLPNQSDWEVRADRAWQLGSTARREIVSLTCARQPVTAFFAAGYYLALETMNTVRESGLRVPEDVSVAGYDDPLSAHLVYPALTTVRQPLYDMGRRAGERLIHLIRGDEARAPIREVLPAQLVVRKSTAPAGAGQPTLVGSGRQ